MINCKLFVIMCSLTTFSTFVLSCYLLSTVNPPPLIEPKKKPDKVGTGNSTDLRDAMKIARRHESLAPFYRFSFDKLITVPIEEGNVDESVYGLPMSIVRNVVPPLSLLSQNPSPETNQKSAKITETEKNILRSNITVDTAILNSDPKSPLLPIKGHRRSIDSFESFGNENPESIILEIIDMDGQSQIEIKINTDSDLNNDKDNTKESSNFILKVQRNDGEDDLVLDYKTKIKIFPNDTVVIQNNNKTKGRKTAATYGFIKQDTIIKTDTISKDNLTVEFNNISVNNIKNKTEQENMKYTTKINSKEQQNTTNNIKKEINILKMNDTRSLKISHKNKQNGLKNTAIDEAKNIINMAEINKKLDITTETNRTEDSMNATRNNSTKIKQTVLRSKNKNNKIHQNDTGKVKVLFSPAKEFNLNDVRRSNVVTKQAKMLLKSRYKSTTPYIQNISLKPKHYNKPPNHFDIVTKEPFTYVNNKMKPTENAKSSVNVVAGYKNEHVELQNNKSINYWKQESEEKSKNILKIDELLDKKIVIPLRNTSNTSSFINAIVATEKLKQLESKNLSETTNILENAEEVNDTTSEKNFREPLQGVKKLSYYHDATEYTTAVKLENRQTLHNITQDIKYTTSERNLGEPLQGAENLSKNLVDTEYTIAVKSENRQTLHNVSTQLDKTTSMNMKYQYLQVKNTVNSSDVLRPGVFVTEYNNVSFINKTNEVPNATASIITEKITERAIEETTKSLLQIVVSENSTKLYKQSYTV